MRLAACRGAFTVVSSPEDMKNLKSIAAGEEPQFATTDEAELYRKAAVLAGRGYSFKAHMAFRPESSPMISILQRLNVVPLHPSSLLDSICAKSYSALIC